MRPISLWNIHSIDDDTVPYATSVDAALALEDAEGIVTRREFPGNLSSGEARETALEQWREADDEGSTTLFTAFSPGTTGVPGVPPTSGHLSWVDVLAVAVVNSGSGGGGIARTAVGVRSARRRARSYRADSLAPPSRYASRSSSSRRIARSEMGSSTVNRTTPLPSS